jgi:hypothetical protein
VLRSAPDKATIDTESHAPFERIGRDGERFVPHRFSDGFYRVADPALGSVRHHAANQIKVTAEEIRGYLEKGFLLRMRGDRGGQVNLIAASEIADKDRSP